MAAFAEKPPMITGQPRKDIENMRDYLFRMAQSLGEASSAGVSGETTGLSLAYRNGTPVMRQSSGNTDKQDVEAVRRNAQELKALIIKSANNLQDMLEAGDRAVVSYANSQLNEFKSL